MEKEVRIPTAFASCSFGLSIRILVCGFYFKHRAHRENPCLARENLSIEADDERREITYPVSGSRGSFFESKPLLKLPQ